MIRGLYSNQLGNNTLQDFPIGQTDISRLRRGMVGGQFWSAYVPCPKPSDTASEQDKVLTPLLQTLQQIDVIHHMIDACPSTFGLATSASDVWNVFRSGRIASLIGIEGLHQIDDSPSVLRILHRLGVRYATLVHTRANRYCDSATDEAVHHGLSEDGKTMVNEMNRIGMIIDLSHTSHKTQEDVLAISKAPVIFSHSACHALVPSPRNTPTSTLHLLKQNNGVIMICFLRELVDPAGGQNATISQVIDHIIYAGETIGFDHVGIGSDFDGMLKGPEGLDDVSCFPKLVVGLLERGVEEENIVKVLGLNVLRVLSEVEEFALREQRMGVQDVLCDAVGDVWTEEQKQILHEQGSQRGLVQT
ncbi:renal dipeptidase family [Aspergillus karnatakaensis]|uniref:dipeptidase gliJ n=1 Tax=Aspergillus karnatakaensis TaxID=1810916 RepID=UPI003CCD6533